MEEYNSIFETILADKISKSKKLCLIVLIKPKRFRDN